jgi:hypothetical protein
MMGAVVSIMRVLRSALVPSHPQPHPFFSVAEAVVDAGVEVDWVVLLFAPRVRSLLWIPALPLLDIAWRRAIDAARPEDDGARAGAE